MNEARSAPAVARNRGPILEVLRRFLPAGARVLELASGTGEHALHVARALPGITWQPSDANAEALASIAAWRAAQGTPNLLAPIALDAADPATWPARADALVAINLIHIAPWAVTQGLFRGAAGLLPPDGVVILYGPYRETDLPTAPSNEAFDADLRARDPAWGLRQLDDVVAEAARNGFALARRIAMPANNLCLVFGRAAESQSG